MPSDKERADMLLDLCEQLFIQGCVLRALLDESGMAEWPCKLSKTLDSDAAIPLREEFREIYQQSLQQADQARFLSLKTSGIVQ